MTDAASPLGIDLSRVVAATLPDKAGPVLLVVLDTEEEFDWGKPFSRDNRGVSAIARIPDLQAEFEVLGVRPTYCIDYPVASTPESADVFARIAQRGTAEVGAHLHPWVTPPEIEEVTRFNSYAGNLDAALERAKLISLAGAIRDQVGVDARTFKAGRYGIAPRTFDTLTELGFRVDLSSAPGFNWTGDGGPDFSLYPNHPYWVPSHPSVLEIPTTGGMYGPLWRLAGRLTPVDNQAERRRNPLLALLRRARLANQAMLTPEGFTLLQLQALADSMLARGERVLSLSFHSPSLAPGHTPFVRTEQDRKAFVARTLDFLRWFASRRGGRFMTASEVHATLSSAAAHNAAGGARQVA